MENTITIHRALAELKLIDARIEKQIGELTPTGTYQKDKLINQHVKKEDFEKSAQSNFDSIRDLLARKIKIKSAITYANATTLLEIAGTVMTIAEAINRKAMIPVNRKLVDRLKRSYGASVAEMNRNNDIVESNVQRLLEAALGKENIEVDKGAVESVRRPYVEANTFHLFDPLKVSNIIEGMEKQIEDFESEVDARLSEINATTKITI